MSIRDEVYAGRATVIEAPALRGLSHDEVARRAARGEKNTPPPATGRTYVAIVRENVFTFINNLLFVLGIALIAVGEVSDAIIAVGVVLGNILVSVVQEVRAKLTLDRIALLTRPKVRVLRDGAEQVIDPAEVVRGDLLIVGAGDQVVVDGPIESAGSVEMDESLLTGEADRITKRTGDTLYSGSFCVSGQAYYRAEQIGAGSFVNSLTANARSYRRILTPLQREVIVIVRVILLVTLFLELILLLSAPVHHITIVAGVEMSVVIAKLVPAGLFLSVTLAYALGALRMVRQGALVQQVNAVESLSNIDVLCLDKTGTLTTNHLALEVIHPIAGNETELRSLLGDYAASTTGGNRTIAALHDACTGRRLPVLAEVSFSSDWKWSGLTLEREGHRDTYVLGAPEVLYPGLGREEEDLMHLWSEQGRRVLLFAGAPERELDGEMHDPPRLPAKLLPLALLSFSEELRPQAHETLVRFTAAGVTPKLISGDNPQTVAALAAQVGLGTGLPAISGPELAEMDEAQRAEAVERMTVFGRVTPVQKEELVSLLKEQGHYVAMIGDGVNDVLPLKRAEVAVAMESGSQAARAVADIVLLGDSFETLPAAVEEGQRIRNGLRDILKLFLTRVLTVAILLVAVALLGGFPFDPKHISILTTFTVGIPSIALAVWARPGPIPRGSVTRSLLHFVLPASLTLALAGIGIYLFVTLNSSGDTLTRAQTALTVMTVACGLLLVPFVQPPTPFWTGGNPLYGDWRPTLLALVLFAAFLGLLAIPPLHSFFGLVPLSALEYGVIAAAVVVWAIVLRFTWRTRLLDRFLGIDLQPPTLASRG